MTFALLAVCGIAALAQTPGSSLPPTAPTSLPAPISATSLPGPVPTKAHRATVTYAAGLLDVRANDSSLNSILREIARLTGMTITGGVADQRVFGNYGPAEPNTVLATLLDGTGTNLFLKEAAENSPAELVLTPRGGGPTPPSPNSAQFSDTDEVDNPSQPPVNPNGPGTGISPRPGPGFSQAPPTANGQMPAPAVSNTGAGGSPSGPMPIPQPLNNVLGNPNAVSPSASTLPVTNSVSTDSLPTPSTAQVVPGIVDSPSGPPSGTTTTGLDAAAKADAASQTTPTPAQSADATGSTLPGGSTNSAGSGAGPNGIRTPEQIFQQLQQLRQAAQTQGQGGLTQPAPTTSTPTANPTTQPAPQPR